MRAFRSPSFVSSFVAEWDSNWDVANLTLYVEVVPYNGVIYHTVTVDPQAGFAEVGDQAGWGTLYYGMQTVSNRILSAFLLSL